MCRSWLRLVLAVKVSYGKFIRVKVCFGKFWQSWSAGGSYGKFRSVLAVAVSSVGVRRCDVSCVTVQRCVAVKVSYVCLR